MTQQNIVSAIHQIVRIWKGNSMAYILSKYFDPLTFNQPKIFQTSQTNILSGIHQTVRIWKWNSAVYILPKYFNRLTH